MIDPLCPIPPHRAELGQTVITYLVPVEVVVDLDERTVLSVFVDENFPLPTRPHYGEDSRTIALAHEIAAEEGADRGWPEWEVG